MGSSAASGFIVLFVYMSMAQSRQVLTYISAQICAVRGSTVDIRCSYRQLPTVKRHSVPVERILWFTEMQDKEPVDLRTNMEYAGRAKYYCDRTTCTLRIVGLRETDSAEYKFKFKDRPMRRFIASPGVTLSVTDPHLQVQVRRSYSTWGELFCHSTCHLPDRPSFIWYKNGQRIQTETSSSYSDYFDAADSYSCAVKGHEDFPSPPMCVFGQICNRVTYSNRSICAVKGSSVDISCTYSSSKDHIESRLWFNPERSDQWTNAEDLREDSQFAGRVQVIDTESGRSTLRITDLRESDSAEYHFKFTTPSFEWRSSLPGTTLTVTDAPKLPSVSLSPPGEVMEGSSVTLTCSSDANPAAKYTWYKENGNLNRPLSEGPQLVFSSIQSSDSGQYYCAAENELATIFESILINVKYAPKLPSVSVSPSAEIVEGSSVTLTCSSDANPAAKYTWYKENQTLSQGQEGIYHFTSISSVDSGIYHCKSENPYGQINSSSLFIDVQYAPKLPSVSVSPSAEIVEGSSVTLTCSSDANPAAKYTWYKENQTLSQGQEGIYHFTSISSVDSGIYHCKSENPYGQINSSSLFIDVQYAPKLPSVSVSPSAEIVEGSSVTLTCSSDANPAANYTWYKEDEDSPKASGQIFTITDIRAEHSGNYYCEVQNTRGRHNSTLYLIVVAVGQACHNTSDHDSGGRRGHFKSILHQASVAAASRSHIVILPPFLLVIVFIFVVLWIRFPNQRHELRRRLNNRAQSLPRLTCPLHVRCVFSEAANHLYSLLPTRWQTEFSSWL
ncbi:B-cell receptor CD22-like [Epinephelus fuscoguttatus]|uniref:B-cell receptor CD22-like n=1 Tax=Epinephelus fuscoguttatus TaxID=293821 RepID=UPI0020D1D009|nr:B-cell receptor CD22-like [Epinephelus fuscoguttatus]